MEYVIQKPIKSDANIVFRCHRSWCNGLVWFLLALVVADANHLLDAVYLVKPFDKVVELFRVMNVD